VNRIENVARLLKKNTLLLERRFSVAPERLWEAVATREGLSRWFMPTPFEIEQGGRFSFEGGWEGTVTLVDPSRRIQFTPDESNEAYLRFEIERASGGCLFRLIDKMGPAADVAKIFGADAPKDLAYQPGGIGTHWSGVVSGYHRFVDALEAHVLGKAIAPDDGDLSRRYMTVLDEWHA
jgi:uncharacterized protein YndB with AHSA1/START domain